MECFCYPKSYIAENLRITEGIINNTVIGSVTPNEGGFTNVTASGAVTGGSITDGTATIDDGAVTELLRSQVLVCDRWCFGCG